MKKRRMRFSPDEHNIMELNYGGKIIRGLIRDESFNGFCVVVNTPFAPQVGDLVEMSVGDAPSGKGEIIRLEPFDKVLLKVGITIFEY